MLTNVQARGRLAPLLDDTHPAVKQLKEKGYAILDVVSAEEAAKLRDGILTDLTTMNPAIDRGGDERVMNVRGSESARDFWCREYDEDQISPDGRVIPAHSRVLHGLPFDSPFQVQMKTSHSTTRLGHNPNVAYGRSGERQEPLLDLAFLEQHPASATPTGLQSSRSVERLVYEGELANLENVAPVPNEVLRRENERLKKENIAVKKQHKLAMGHFNSALQINQILTRELARRAAE